jgi:hypothetical protein
VGSDFHDATNKNYDCLETTYNDVFAFEIIDPGNVVSTIGKSYTTCGIIHTASYTRRQILPRMHGVKGGFINNAYFGP